MTDRERARGCEHKPDEWPASMAVHIQTQIHISIPLGGRHNGVSNYLKSDHSPQVINVLQSQGACSTS